MGQNKNTHLTMDNSGFLKLSANKDHNEKGQKISS